MKRGNTSKQPARSSNGSWLWILIGLLGASVVTPSWAINNSTNLYNGTTTNIGGAYTFPATTGTNNYLLIQNGGSVTNTSATLGSAAGSDWNTAIVSSNNSLWYNSGSLLIGDSGANNQLLITNGGRVKVASTYTYLGFTAASASNNSIVVTGPNSILDDSGLALGVGRYGPGSQLIITNGGTVLNDTAYLSSFSATSSSNSVIVTGAGSVWSNATIIYLGHVGNGNQVTVSDGGTVYVGASGIDMGASTGSGNTLLVTNGGRVFNKGNLIVSDTTGAASNNTVIVTGPGSVLTNGGNVLVGRSTSGNRLLISNGGVVINNIGYLGATAAGGIHNTGIVTGAGSVWSNTSSLTVGNAGASNILIISSGGKVYSAGANVGVSGGSASNNVLWITGDGSAWQTVTSGFLVQNNSSALIENGGMIDTPTISVGAGSSLTNRGGIFQFTSSNPTIFSGTIVVTNGILSFRNVADANVYCDVNAGVYYFPSYVTFQGNNTFRLNNSSNSTAVNASQDYTFDTGRGGTNFVRLELVNGTTLWRSKYVTLGSGGGFLASNTIGTVAAVVTNLGTIEVNNSTMTWQSNVVISGSYRSDPSTNTFLADVTVNQSGTLSGGPGDLFDFKKNLIIHSTNNTGFKLASAAVRFSGGGMHTNAITGQDLGTNLPAYTYSYSQDLNFAYGELHLGSITDQICFTCGNLPAVPSNGLYIGWLDLLNNTSLVTNLHAASGINLYYNLNDPRNNYLAGATYPLTDCSFAIGGGFLMPIIPEPGTLVLFVLAAGAALRKRHR